MKCRHCESELTLPFVDLGSAPPSNSYFDLQTLSAPERWYPLKVYVCTNCWLVQTEDYAGREEFFSDDYAYFSSFSTSWLRHAETYVEAITSRLELDAGDVAVEVAANDGYLLQYFLARSIPCYGIEPSASTAQAARAKGIEIIEEFFGASLAAELANAGRQANLTVANNVLAHVPEINDFVKGFAILLKPEGVATFEFPHLLNLVLENQFDTIYHEHYSYLSLMAVSKIFKANGLEVFDVEELPSHGGSLRVYAQRANTGRQPVASEVDSLLAREKEAGVDTEAFYTGFQARANKIKNELLTFLIDAKRHNKAVAAYGAAAKGNTLLNYAGVRPDLLPYVVDKNPTKQGMWMPGSRIPIVAEEQLHQDKPDYVLILPWNLKDEIIEQMKQVREWGCKFVVMIPEMVVIE